MARTVLGTTTPSRHHAERAAQLRDALQWRTEGFVVLLDAYDELLSMYAELSGTTVYAVRTVAKRGDVCVAVLTRHHECLPAMLEDPLNRFMPFVHYVGAFRLGDGRRLLVVYYRSGRATAADMGPLADADFRRQHLLSAFDVIVGDFNATGDGARDVVHAFAREFTDDSTATARVPIGTRKCRTPFNTQHTKCGEVTGVTIVALTRSRPVPMRRFLLSTPDEDVVDGAEPFVPCAGHFSDHYAVATEAAIAINCAASQTSGMEFMTDALVEPNADLWRRLQDDTVRPYAHVAELLGSD